MSKIYHTFGNKSAHDVDCILTRRRRKPNINNNKVKKIIIEGMTQSGRKFRPSDWAERMSGALSTFGRDQRIRYSPMMQPLIVDGIKCIALDPKMQDQFPEMYSYIMGWADNNDLVVNEEDVVTVANETQG